MEENTSKFNEEYKEEYKEDEYCDYCGRECDGIHAIHTPHKNIPKTLIE
jgi:hypothetical protein